MFRYRHAARLVRAVHVRSKTSGRGTFPARRPFSSACLDILQEAGQLAGKVANLSGRPTHDETVTRVIRVLQNATQEINSHGLSSRIRIAVYSFDKEDSILSSLVTTLIYDPLSSDNEQQSRIRKRWDTASMGNGAPLTFEFRPQYSVKSDTNTIYVTSPWLSRRLVSLVEVPPSTPLDETTQALLLSADIPIIVISPLVGITGGFLDLLRSVNHPNLVIVVNAVVGTRTAELTREAFRRINESSSDSTPRLLFVNIEQALHALDALQGNSSSAAAIQDYQNSTSNSCISSLTDVVDSMLDAQDIEALRNQVSLSLARKAVTEVHSHMSRIEDELASTKSLTSNLRGLVQSDGDIASRELFGPSTDLAVVQVGDSNPRARESDYGTIYDLHEKAGKPVRVTIDGLKWWKLPILADEVSYRINDALDRAYTSDVERHLVFHSGQLSALQSNYLSHTSTTLTSRIPASLTSPLLSNTLAQLSAKPAFRILPTTLLAPALNRLYSLQTSTTRLHKSANRLVLSTATSWLTSSVLSAYLYIASFLDIATSLGLASFVSIGVLRWAVGRWERAKGRWWDDWKRVGRAVERDVRAQAKTCLEKQVFVVPLKACEGVEELVRRREEELKEVYVKLGGLEKSLKANESSGCVSKGERPNSWR